MALNDISFVKGQGGLGRPLPGSDFVSALLFYTATLPSGFTTSARVKKLFSPADAIAAGINKDYSDATSATGTYLITVAGATGDQINISVNEPNGILKSLGTYTKLSTDTTIAILGASIAAFINTGTVLHGYTASFTTATLTITAPKKMGIFLNSGTPIVVTITGTIAGTLTQFAGGVASKQAVWYYHISEFFRKQPQGVLFVGFYAVPGSYTFSEIQLMQQYAVGAIRQMGVYKDAATFATADLTAIQAICATLDGQKQPLSVLYAADMTGLVLSNLTDLSSLTANKVTAIIGQDGGGQGQFLWLTYGKSITVLGAALGTVALASVSQNIAWVAAFNISNGVECETLAFANGVLYSDSTISDSLLGSLNSYRYVFLRKFIGTSGSFFNDSHTAIVASSDYAYIENNRTIDKAIRGVYASLLPSLNSPIQLNASGTLSETTMAYFIGLAEVNLNQMQRDKDLSAFQVTIDPTQNVLATSILYVAIKLVIKGVARNIIVPIGFTPSI